jgi:hypothetical protein
MKKRKGSRRSAVGRGLYVALGIAAIALTVRSQQTDRESGAGRPESQAAVRAAIAYAKQLAPEGTAEYTAALRKALALAGGLPISAEATRSITVFASMRGLLDLDQRYRRNLTSSVDETVRIWGGETVPPGTYPDTVALLGNGRICSGTVIASNMVLTAAHCYCNGVTERAIVGDTINAPLSTIPVSGAEAMVTCNESVANGDISVLKLAAALTVRPRAFANEALVSRASSARAVGYGRTANPITEPAGIKRRVDVPIASTACNGKVTTANGPVDDSVYYGCAPEREIVAGAPSLDRDSCNGDSGGPLFVTGRDGNLYLAGATSRPTGPPGLRPCGDGGIYVRTDARVVKWLASRGVTVTVGPPE